MMDDHFLRLLKNKQALKKFLLKYREIRRHKKKLILSDWICMMYVAN